MLTTNIIDEGGDLSRRQKSWLSVCTLNGHGVGYSLRLFTHSDNLEFYNSINC